MTKYQRALEIWRLLVRAAEVRRTYTYSELASLVGLRGPRPMWQFLEPVMRYCDAKNLPPLTVLVLQKTSGRPGTGLLTTTDPVSDQRRVFAFDWRSLSPPNVQDLESASR